MFDGIEDALKVLPIGWRFSVGHVPHLYRRDEMPKQLRKKPYEAYVINNEMFGTSLYVFVNLDAETPAKALKLAISAALSAYDLKIADAKKKQETKPSAQG